MSRILACIALLFCIESPIAQTQEPSSAVQQKLSTIANQTPELKAYAAFLDSLDLTNPESNLRAAFAMFEGFDSASAPIRDDAFRLFFAFYLTNIQSSTEELLQETAASPHQKPAKYFLCGIDFDWCEGETWAKPNVNFVFECSAFLDRNSRYRGWMDTYWAIHEHAWACDGGSSLDAEQIRGYILKLEQTAKWCYGVPELKESIYGDLGWLIAVYLEGLGNTRRFEPWSGSKLSDFDRQSWESYIRENQSSIFYPLVKAAYDSAATTGFTDNPGVRQVTSKAWDFSYTRTLIDEMLRKAEAKK